MDKNSIIGLVLIFMLLFVWQFITKPTEEQLAEHQRTQDSLLQVQNKINETAAMPGITDVVNDLPDSIRRVQLQAKLGEFASAATGTESVHVIENDLLKLSFSNKGGKIKEIELKKYKKNLDDKKKPHDQVPVKLFEDEKNRFEYILPVNTAAGVISTNDLFFQPSIQGNVISFKASLPSGASIEQVYKLAEGSYGIDYDVKFNGMDQLIKPGTNQIELNWVNYLDKIEINDDFEKYYTSVYYKMVDETPNYCSCRGDDEEDIEEKLKWVSHANQFFNTTLVANQTFESGLLTTQMEEEDSEDLKKLTSKIQIPIQRASQETISMKIFSGPNDFNTLKAFSPGLENIIPYGWSIFGTINRWVIRPSFDFLSRFIGSKGLVIILLTFLIKMLVFPLTYKMLYSQQKMAALKPRLAKLKEKFKDDQQQYSVEQMKMYREYGASPLGGCMPMVLQMPIWYALFRFFPSSLDFRQASFLWADDLSSFDVAMRLPTELPFGFGDHLSLFTILWAITTIIYTFYNTRHMDMGANPAMKYMQYAMPLMFLVFFNSYSSGLTCYMFFSNLINIAQTIITKNFVIDKKKIEAELVENKKKPKKKGGFQQKLEDIMKEQQKLNEDREKTIAKGKKNKK